MKKEVIIALQDKTLTGHSRFNTLAALYRQTPNHNLGQSRYFNTAGYTKETLSSLEYELKKAHQITDVELRVANFKPALTNEQKLAKLDPENVSLADAQELATYSKYDELVPEVPKFDKGLPGNKQMKEFLTSYDVKPKSKKADLTKQIGKLVAERQREAVQNLIDQKVSYDEAQASEQEEQKIKEREVNENKAKQVFAIADPEVKESVKLRDEFPFLAEDDCPDEFKILVADKMTAYQKFIDARAQLKALQDDPEADLFEIAKKAVENFELNLDIYDELEYYKEHGEILGHHPIFEKMLRKKAVDALTDVEAKSRQANLRTYVSRDSKKLAKMEPGEARDKFEAKYNGFVEELALIDARLEKE